MSESPRDPLGFKVADLTIPKHRHLLQVSRGGWSGQGSLQSPELTPNSQLCPHLLPGQEPRREEAVDPLSPEPLPGEPPRLHPGQGTAPVTDGSWQCARDTRPPAVLEHPEFRAPS